MTNNQLIEAARDLPFEQGLNVWEYLAREQALKGSMLVLNDPRFVTWCSKNKSDIGLWLDGKLGPHPRRTKP